MVNRHPVGAHYGIGSWLLQRMTALIMAVYTLVMLVFLFALPHDYVSWQAFFAKTWVRLFTQMTFAAVALHAWVGVRDIWMDYIKCTKVRLLLHTTTILWLVGALLYSIKVIWGVA